MAEGTEFGARDHLHSNRHNIRHKSPLSIAIGISFLSMCEIFSQTNSSFREERELVPLSNEDEEKTSRDQQQLSLISHVNKRPLSSLSDSQSSRFVSV